MLTPWYQFTVYYPGTRNTQYALVCMADFLPRFRNTTRPIIHQWHYLFEPSCLVRVKTDHIEAVMKTAEELAKECGLAIERGDIADAPTSAPPPSNAGFQYKIEREFYGNDLVFENLDFLEASSNLALAVSKRPPAEQLKFLQKHLHLLCNQFGLNYAEESQIMQERARRAAKFYLEAGRI